MTLLRGDDIDTMRKIYESGALDRDDKRPFKPGETDQETTPRAMRSLSGGLLSRLFVPTAVQYWGLSVSISTPRSTYDAGTPIPFTVTIVNRLPVPVTVRTATPVLWSWEVNGVREASRVSELPDRAGQFRFDRGERKRFRRRWHQSFRVSEGEWEAAAPGDYCLRAAVAIENASETGLSDETTIRIE